jgi:flagellar hook-associated protein 1 FlgK
VQQSLLLCNTMNDLSGKIDDLRSSLDETVTSKVSQVNSIASQVASLNSQIVSFEAGGKMASDLRDKRDYLLQQLSQVINFTCNELSDGSYSIDVGGKLLVWNTEYTNLATQADEDDPLYLKNVVWEDSLTEVNVTSGELGGLLYVRDTVIPGYRDKVDSLVNGLVKQINITHSQGWGLNGYGSLTAGNAVSDADVAMGSSASGLAFYSDITDGTVAFNAIDASGAVATFEVAVTDDMTLTEFAAAVNTAGDNLGYVSASISGGLLSLDAGAGYTVSVIDESADASNLLMALGINTFFSGSEAAEMNVAQAIQDDPDKIAAAASYNPGDNANALAIAALKDTRLMQNATLTFDSFYQTGIIGNLGVAITEAEQMKDNQELIVEQLQDSISRVSGVSLDEEMTVMMQYQHAYEASAKYLTMINEMLDNLMNVV